MLAVCLCGGPPRWCIITGFVREEYCLYGSMLVHMLRLKSFTALIFAATLMAGGLAWASNVQTVAAGFAVEGFKPILRVLEAGP